MGDIIHRWFQMPTMDRTAAIAFADQLRAARQEALGDAEAFDGVIHAVERIGSFLTKERLGDKGEDGSLYQYETEITEFAVRSGMASEVPNRFRNVLAPFSVLYDLVRVARNDALHQGAFARHLTTHAIELAIILEDALRHFKEPYVSDFMVRNPVCAELWQPIGLIRQQMLAHSYSSLPVRKDGNWYLVCDTAIATYLGPETSGKKRKQCLASTLKEAVAKPAVARLQQEELSLTPVDCVGENTTLADGLRALNNAPALLICKADDPERLLGIVTAFDLL